MGHQQAYRAAVDGKLRVNKIHQSSELSFSARRLTFAAAFALATFAVSPSHAQSGPFAGMAGTWSGGGSVTLDDGSRERIRCRATYRVGGVNMAMTLTCASDAYKFNLQADVVAQGGAITGNWTEGSRGISGSLQGRGGGGNFQVAANAAGFNANLSMRTSGNKQSVSISADSGFRAASISLAR
ncbi:hypothetical protein [Bradyrhizobium sp. Ai1a-2]|uniref:hypothetical protein n=1 Tax=Bradyrhizobium sp. Ai1a-2 TaxID=196490 RepID=UPI0004834511|nr:hypothetical protein [Bradyrhizobium sp. Ai1a-2]